MEALIVYIPFVIGRKLRLIIIGSGLICLVRVFWLYLKEIDDIIKDASNPIDSYKCKDEDEKHCRTSCLKFMRGECEGRNGILNAGGSWINNKLIKKMRRLIANAKN